MTLAVRFTSADLDTLPDLPGVRYEIIDGELYVSKAPQFGHQYPAGVVHVALHAWSEETGAGYTCEVPGLVFTEDNDVIPDLVWIRKDRLAEALDGQGHFRLAPDLIVEVLSPGRVNQLRDRESKLALYSRQGVQEYWIVDWQAQTVEIFRRGATGLELQAALGNDDVLTSPLLPGFRCPVAKLWAPTLP